MKKGPSIVEFVTDGTVILTSQVTVQVTYGNFEGAKKGYISTENIFGNIFQVPQKKGPTKPLPGFLEDIGFHLESGEVYSTRVCSPIEYCSRKNKALPLVYDLPNPVGNTANTSFPLKSDKTASSC